MADACAMLPALCGATIVLQSAMRDGGSRQPSHIYSAEGQTEVARATKNNNFSDFQNTSKTSRRPNRFFKPMKTTRIVDQGRKRSLIDDDDDDNEDI